MGKVDYSFTTLEVFENMMTVPDCIVNTSNKLGAGHGEAKFYIASKNEMRGFYDFRDDIACCFMLKKDLLTYMVAIKNEYTKPSQPYRSAENLPQLWEERHEKVNKLPEVIEFKIQDQTQIQGPRGYINSKDEGYELIRELSLPLVSYIYSEKVKIQGEIKYYWRLFVDFEALADKQIEPLVFTYGKVKKKIKPPKAPSEDTKAKAIREARHGQGKYREQLIGQVRYCPITKITDERILIASHIKPWSVSNDKEKIDPYNGYLLSPMFDKLFDKGFMTFTSKRRIKLSDAISPYTWKLIGIKDDAFIQDLPMDEKREKYLQFHHDYVFKGNISYTMVSTK